MKNNKSEVTVAVDAAVTRKNSDTLGGITTINKEGAVGNKLTTLVKKTEKLRDPVVGDSDKNSTIEYDRKGRARISNMLEAGKCTNFGVAWSPDIRFYPSFKEGGSALAGPTHDMVYMGRVLPLLQGDTPFTSSRARQIGSQREPFPAPRSRQRPIFTHILPPESSGNPTYRTLAPSMGTLPNMDFVLVSGAADSGAETRGEGIDPRGSGVAAGATIREGSRSPPQHTEGRPFGGTDSDSARIIQELHYRVQNLEREEAKRESRAPRAPRHNHKARRAERCQGEGETRWSTTDRQRETPKKKTGKATENEEEETDHLKYTAEKGRGAADLTENIGKGNRWSWGQTLFTTRSLEYDYQSTLTNRQI
ncbi:uncharacterized protein DS421_14g454830 [Arachis hypogaea]|nr:uncharacterized protein DS421_14g454830 [Arachis hypogaea]